MDVVGFLSSSVLPKVSTKVVLQKVLSEKLYKEVLSCSLKSSLFSSSNLALSSCSCVTIIMPLLPRTLLPMLCLYFYILLEFSSVSFLSSTLINLSEYLITCYWVHYKFTQKNQIINWERSLQQRMVISKTRLVGVYFGQVSLSQWVMNSHFMICIMRYVQTLVTYLSDLRNINTCH